MDTTDRDTTDLRGILADIERDVRDQRRIGTISAEFEADLAHAFAEVSPAGAVGGGFEAVVDQAARHAIVDYDAPIVGSAPLRFVKKTVKTLTAWYLIFVGRQLVAFAGTTLRALRLLGGRVDSLEHQSPSTDPRLRATSLPVDADWSIAEWTSECIAAIAENNVTGRVVHGDCGDGSLVAALVASKCNAYGVDPRSDAGAVADAQRVEVRSDDLLAHLRSLGDESLGAVVASGCVDRLALGDQIELVAQAVRVVRPGGILVIIGRDPRAWARDQSTLASDLVIGRPLHSETWAYLMSQSDCDVITQTAARVAIPEAVLQSSDPAVALLAQEVFVPSSFFVAARRR